jgi:hypothetical protein
MKMKMTSKYNKLRCNTKDGFLKRNLSHICIRKKDHQMCFKRHTYQNFISSSHVCFVVELLFSIYFVMTIIYLKVPINYKVTLNSYNEINLNQDLLSTTHMELCTSWMKVQGGWDYLY